MSENANVMDINIDLTGTQRIPAPPARNSPNAQNPGQNAQNAQNAQNPRGHAHLNAARFDFHSFRDRLFHAMLVRVALKYSGRVNVKWRKFIEGCVLFVALTLFFSLTFIHFNFTKSPISCLDDMNPEWTRQGIVRIEVVQNLEVLEEKEHFINQYVSAKSARVCHLNPADVFRFGPSVIPVEMRRKKVDNTEILKKAIEKRHLGGYMSVVFSMLRSQIFYDEQVETPKIEKYIDLQEDFEYTDPLETEAHMAYVKSMKGRKNRDYKYVYRVEYALLFGLLRLPPEYREEHNIPTTWIRIDSKSKCFGDKLSRLMMNTFIGYDEPITSALRHQSVNSTWHYPDSYTMGYMHNILSHETFTVVSSIQSRSAYFTAFILMLIFTFAISMLLRFSHHQIFVFIIDLLHMFELQQPLNPPVAPLVTVVLALVGMEAIMAEVFNDTSIAFYVILIVWVADQYDAICCHSSTSKRYWLRFFYLYQFFFYAYQYRFNGQYSGLALTTASAFILHSMIYFFHHYEMPLILYQDRVSQVLADLHAPTQNGMGTVEVQTITVAVHNRSAPIQRPDQIPANLQNNGAEPMPAEPLSPSSVFDARGPNIVQPEPPAAAPEPQIEAEPRNPEEIIAHQIVNDAMNELFNHE